MKTFKTLLSTLGHFAILTLLLLSARSYAQNAAPAMALDKIVETTFEVRDFEVWKPLFLKDSLMRRQHGIETIVISSKAGHPLQLMTVSMVKDVKQAQDFIKDPSFLKRTGERGVTNVRSEYYEVMRFNPDAQEPRWLIMDFKVKDYEVWLKDFDKGQTLRSDAGLVDVLIARDINHPLKIQVVLDMKDINKAKALMTSEILKERMKNAGVIGKPNVEYYEGR